MYRFGGVAVDPRAREVVRDGVLAHLEPQAFDLLVHLIEHRGEVVAKHDLLDGVWGHRFVSEAVLTTRIKEIRRAVGDDGATQHTIRNVRGRGYRFVAELAGEREERHGGDRSSFGLIGRADELTELVSRFEVAPVVTLVGPGGVGKSTLARAALPVLAAGAADGGHVIELAPIDSGAHVVAALARPFDVAIEPDRPERALSAVARLDAVLLVDNCEHVVDEVAEAVDRMMTTPGAQVRVLATSQVRLGVGVEQVIGLAPLEPAEALALFDLRARAARPGWQLDAVDVDRVRALLEQLDRLPLTVEMAAARLASMTFDELEVAVAEGGRLVQLSHRTPTRRHRTLGSLVEWSAGLLPPEQRRVFVGFAVFAGPVTAVDASAVLGTGAAATIAELAERSLLAVDLSGPTATFRMLDTVKGVARRWLEDDDRCVAVHTRHASAVADAVASIDRALRSPDELAGRRRLDEVVAELRQAHRWARAHQPALADRMCAGLHLASYGRLWGEPASWSREMPDDSDSDSGAARWPGAQLLVAGAAANTALLDVARAQAERALAATTDPRLQGTAHEILSDVAIYSGRLADCSAHTLALAELGARLGDSHMLAIATVNESLVHTFGGDPARGRERLTGVDTTEMSPSSLAWLAYARGEALADLGDTGGAVAAFEDAIELAGSVANPFVVSVGQSSLATEHARHGSRDAAYEVYAACLRGYLRYGNLVHAVTTVRNLVALLHADGDQRGAVVLGTATTDDALRPTYGAESIGLATVLGEVESSVWPDRFAAWVDEGRTLDLDGIVRRALAVVEAHL